MATEGQTAVGPNGQRAVYQGGQWVVLSDAQAPQASRQVSVTPLPRNPAEVAQEARDNARNAATDVRADRSETRQMAATNAQLYTQGLMIGPDGVTPVPIPNWKPPAGAAPALTAKERADAIQAFKDAEALDRLALGMHGKFGASIGQTSGLSGIQDYFPTAENQALDQQAQRARGYVKRSLGFTGGESNTVAESSSLYDPYLPSSWDKDQNAANKIAALEQLARDARAQSVAILGGVPDANGRITPVPEGQDPSVWTANRLAGGAAPTAAGVGAQTAAGDAIPPAMQAEHDAWLKQNLGQFDPTSYADFRTALDQKYGYPADYQRHLDWGTSTAEKLRAGGATISPTIPAADRQLSGVERFRNDMAANPVGAGAINFADAAGMGGVSFLMPDAMQANNAENPNAAMLGQMGGAILGAGWLGKGAGKAFASALPGTAERVMADGAGKAFARSLGTDAAYSGIYGANTGQDPLISALSGAVGSGLGQAVGKTAGAAIGGVARTPAAEFLRARGVPLTVGQALGGMAKKTEDAMTSLPFAGDMAAARRLEGLEGYNRAAFQDVGSIIDAPVSNIGEQGVNDLLGDPANYLDGGATGRAYDAATAGVTVPLDGPFMADLQQVTGRSRMLPPDHAARFGQAMDNRLSPIATAGEMTGDQYQQAMRGLKGYLSSDPHAAPGFEADYRDSITGAMAALTGAMQRGGGEGVISGLARADQAYRGAKTLRGAVQAAKNGTGSGEVQVFTPAQHNTAATQAANKYGGPRQSAELIDTGQQTLPSSIPDSGTGRRVMQAGVGTGILGATGGYDYSNRDVSATSKALALTALLTAGGTKTGQRALTAALMDRPELLQKIGSTVAKKKGLFGRALTPAAIQYGN